MKVAPQQAKNNSRRSSTDTTQISYQNPTAQITDQRQQTVVLRALIEGINESPRMLARRQKIESYRDSGQPHSVNPPYAASQNNQQPTIQRVKKTEDGETPLQGKFDTQPPTQPEQQSAVKPNNTGLPDKLKSGIETLSGISMDNVKVHYNSSQPAQLNALAYAQGTDIHIAPGQERHLPHEAWHVVQQAQGRVKPTYQLKKGIAINNDKLLEREADMLAVKTERISMRKDLLAKSINKKVMLLPPKQKNVPVQRKIKIKSNWYSFQKVHDENGNPYLRNKNNKKLAFKNNVNYSFDTKEVSNYYVLQQDNSKKIFKNFGYGRAMQIKFKSGRKAYFEPFRSYTFGYNTSPEIAMFEGNKGTRGLLYPDYFKEMEAALDDIEDISNDSKKEFIKKFLVIITKMEPLIFAETYREGNAKIVFQVTVNDAQKAIRAAFNAAITVQESVKKSKTPIKSTRSALKPLDIRLLDLKEIITKQLILCTTDLPWAGGGGAAKFADAMIEEKRSLKRKETFDPEHIYSDSEDEVAQIPKQAKANKSESESESEEESKSEKEKRKSKSEEESESEKEQKTKKRTQRKYSS